jgi:hypothetical protein
MFGCSHKHTSFPMSRRVKEKIQPCYIVCLDCGEEFLYDWERMEVIEAKPKVLAGKLAVIR